jgi:hypothetical protein
VRRLTASGGRSSSAPQCPSGEFASRENRLGEVVAFGGWDERLRGWDGVGGPHVVERKDAGGSGLLLPLASESVWANAGPAAVKVRSAPATAHRRRPCILIEMSQPVLRNQFHPPTAGRSKTGKPEPGTPTLPAGVSRLGWIEDAIGWPSLVAPRADVVVGAMARPALRPVSRQLAACGPLQGGTAGRPCRSRGCSRLSGLRRPLCAVRTFDNVTTIARRAHRHRVLIQRRLASQLRGRLTPARLAPRWARISPAS